MTAGGRLIGRIDAGLLVLVGVGSQDEVNDVQYLAGKIRELRIFPDADGKMNRDVAEHGGSVLVVSQFTLFADARNGRRPSFAAAAGPELAQGLYEALIAALRAHGLPVETGEFRAHMDVALVNDGPVTILLDSRKQF